MRYGVIIAGGRSTRFGEGDKAVADLAETPMIRRVADRIAGVVDRVVVNARSEQVPAIRSAMEGYDVPVACAEDPDPDQGPMAGIRTGLRGVERWADDPPARGDDGEPTPRDAGHGGGGTRGDEDEDGDEPAARDQEDGNEPTARDDADPAAFVVACDMPFVEPAVVEYLFERAAGRDAAVPQLEDEWFQTTHAVYRPGPMADACDEKLAAGEHKIIAPLFDLDYVVVDEDDVRECGSLETFENVNTREELERAEARLSE